ncbi:MAG: ABC transporter ATP-binding protein [Dehalococcoidia bacterium]
MSSKERPVIEAQNLSRSYGRVKAISGVDLAIAPGEKVVLIGPNGSGKTTLIKLFSTLIKPTSGTLRLFGKDALSDGASLRRNIGVLLHEPLLYNRLTAGENLHFYAKMFQVSEANRRITELTDSLGIGPLLDKRVATLSHGQRKRVSLLRTLLHDPPLLLLDEPDSGLDPEAMEGLLQVVHRNGRTVVMSTHNFEHGFSMAQRIIVLKKGAPVMDFHKDSLDRSELEKRYAALIKA